MAGRTLFPSQMVTIFTYYHQATQITKRGYTYDSNGKMTSDGKRFIHSPTGLVWGKINLRELRLATRQNQSI
jgi:hypothetical protein